jgi:hypothetical protein
VAFVCRSKLEKAGKQVDVVAAKEKIEEKHIEEGMRVVDSARELDLDGEVTVVVVAAVAD